MFKKHEAPNMALSAISSEKVKRGCGIFWSWVCCLPTLGGTVGSCGPDGNKTDYINCCYPNPVSLPSRGGLKELIDYLQALKIDRDFSQYKAPAATVADHKDASTNAIDLEREYIKWQVENTIRVLRQALDKNEIQGSYKTAIQEVLLTIESRVEHANAFAKVTTKPEQGVPLLIDFKPDTYVMSPRK